MTYDSLNRDRLLLILRIYNKDIYIPQVSGVRCQVSGVRCQVSGVRGERSDNEEPLPQGWPIPED